MVIVAKTGRNDSYRTSAARLVMPNIAAMTGPMQHTEAPRAVRIDAAIPARAKRSSVRSFMIFCRSVSPWGDITAREHALRRGIPPPGVPLVLGPSSYGMLRSA